MNFKERKSVETVFLVTKAFGGRITILPLAKLLYIIDREAIESWERPITCDHMVNMEKGPVPSQIYDIHKKNINSAIWNEFLDSKKNLITIKKEMKISYLSDNEIELIKRIVNRFTHLSPKRLNSVLINLTHQYPEYVDPGDSSIPVELSDILSALDYEPSEISRVYEQLSREDSFAAHYGG